MRFFIAILAASVLVVAVDASVPPHSRPVVSPVASAADVACRIDGGGHVTGPSADICEQVVRRWTLLVGTPPIPGEIRLVNGVNYHGTDLGTSWILEWAAAPKNQMTPGKRKRDGLAPHIALNIVTHEAGHHVFANYIALLNTGAGPSHYATLAPDWIDEAPAVWMESKSSRQDRMRGIAHSSPSLARLVTMEHPTKEYATEATATAGFRSRERTVTPPCPRCTFLPESVRSKYRLVDVGVNADGRPDTIVEFSARNPNGGSSVESREFYPLSYSLLRFIRIRGGVAAVQELIGRYRDNPTPRVEVLAGLPGLPSTIPAFEQAWLQFLRNPPPEDQ